MRAKCLFIALSLLVGAAAYAQTNNFSVTEDGKVIWQKVYETTMSYEEILSNLLKEGLFTDVLDNNGILTCHAPRLVVDVKALGYNRGAVPIYVATSNVSCFVTIQVREGRYRVTAENIILISADGSAYTAGEERPIETWAVKKGKLTGGFSSIPSKLYDAYFESVFRLKGKSYINDEW